MNNKEALKSQLEDYAEKLRAAEADPRIQELAGRCEAKRPTPWVEASIEDKIERLRNQVKIAQAELGYAFERISEVQRQAGRLNGHTHDHMGRAVIPIAEECREGGNCCGQAQSETDPTKVYF